MKTLRLLTILGVCCVSSTLGTLVGNTVWAAEPPPAKPATSAANESAAPKGNEPAPSAADKPVTPATPKQGTQDEEAAPAQPAAKSKGSGKGGSPERFVPSEQVRADFDVSFPIDI